MLRASSVQALEAAVRRYNGVALMSLSAWPAGALEDLCALAVRYGAVAAVPAEMWPAVARLQIAPWNVYCLE